VQPERIETLRAQWGIARGEQVILLPGRLTRWKGQLVLIEALASLQCSGELGSTKAVLTGDPQGRDAYVAELEAAVARHGLSSRVCIARHVTDMPAAYLASDIVVSASTDPEAFGRVAAEAGAMERSVIATDHGGARETILVNRSGLLVQPGNPLALAEALKTLLGMSAECRRQMGSEGRVHIRANFSLERMCEDTIRLYRRCLSRTPAL
jgi:glycosyltransferase involved in cell wall biosynthesis